jgi:2-acylglycerol O-acyltransferase 2
MYLLNDDAEVIKIRDRKGFVRIAVEHGAPILPVYAFGNSRMLKWGPKCLEPLSRRLRCSIGLISGRWGGPLPFKVQIMMATGALVPVRRLPRGHPDFEAAVDEAHAAYMAALADLYSRRRAQYGWADRPLVMV